MNSKKQTATPESKAPNIWLSVFQKICIWYTCISLFMLLMIIIFAEDKFSYADQWNLFFFPFALCLAFATIVRRTDKLPSVLRIILHPVCALGGFALFVYLPSDASPVILLLAAVIYGVATLITWLITRRKKQKAVDNSHYVSQFKPRS